jgi:RHS repeat-associated protein
LNRSLTYGIDWNAQGKVRFIGREEGSDKDLLVFHYDGMGNRVRKVVVPRNSSGETLPVPKWTFTYYIRVAQGNHLTTLERKLTDIDTEEGWDELHIQETMLYGSDRLGVRNWEKSEDAHPASLIAKRVFTHDGLDNPMALGDPDYTGSVITSTAPANYATHLEGAKRYELKNHLGNVLATVSDKRDAVDDSGDVLYYQPKVTNWKFYYPFGSDMVGLTSNPDDHPFDFNGKPTDRELDDWQDYGMRMYMKRLIRFPSPDPLIVSGQQYPWYSPYHFAGNTPLWAVDLDGLEPAYLEGGIWKAAGDQFRTNPPVGSFVSVEQGPGVTPGAMLGVAAVGVTLLSPIPGDEAIAITYLMKSASAGLDVASQAASGDEIDMVGPVLTLLPLPGSELMKEGVDAAIDVNLKGEIRTPFGSTGEAAAKSISETIIDGVGGVGGNALKGRVPNSISSTPIGGMVIEGVSNGVENIGGTAIKNATNQQDEVVD